MRILSLTELPLLERRRLDWIVAYAGGLPLPLPLSLAEGQLAHSKADLNRLFHHFLAQGYEGIVTKRLDAPYSLSARDPNWRKRKEAATLDLVILGATYSADTQRHGAFGSYVLGARRPDGGFEEVGDVDGLDFEKDQQLQDLIVRHGLATGRRIERQLTHGWRSGVELVPSIVAIVRFQNITRESDGSLSLRHPVLKALRTDKPATEADTVQAIQGLFIQQRLA